MCTIWNEFKFYGNNWQEDTKTERIIDRTTGDSYFNDDTATVRFKCFALLFAVPLAQPITSLISLAYRVVNLISGSHFWVQEEGEYNFAARLTAAGADLLRIIALPLSIVGLELAALYGAFGPSPYDARKLFGAIERNTFYASEATTAKEREEEAKNRPWFIAPCFQPQPTHHLFHGDINSRNAW